MKFEEKIYKDNIKNISGQKSNLKRLLLLVYTIIVKYHH